MAAPATKVAVVVLTYNSDRFVDGCFASLRGADRDGLDVEVIAVDNASSDGTAAAIAERYPEVTLVRSASNLGFAEGNNVGIRRALSGGAEFVYLLNPDTEVAPRFLREAVAVARADERVASVQSLLVLGRERDRVNSAGNAIHYLGFGYCEGYRSLVESIPANVRDVAYGSGAAVLYRAKALRDVGLLDRELFLYHEDLDLGWRLRLAGYRNVLAPASRVFHDYEFSRNGDKLYYMERNRLLVLAMNARARTLLVLAPALAAAELGVFALALRSGWASQKLRATAHLVRPSTWRHVLRERRARARSRVVPDRAVFDAFTSTISFEGVTSGPLERLANPLMAATWRILRPFVT